MKLFRWPSVMTGVVILFLVTGHIHHSVTAQNASAQTQLQSPETQNRPGFARAYELSDAFRTVSKQALPAVVSITTKGKVVQQTGSRGNSRFNDPLLRQFFNDPRFRGQQEQREEQREFRRPSGQGSGFIIDTDGVVMTNHHVVADADEVIVRLSDGREFKAVDVKSDARSDVAVLKLDVDEKLPFLPLGDDDEMEIGDWVLAFGSPFGLHRTVTQGIISAKGRGLSPQMTQEFLQTDAAINPGNSGGPLVNLRGEVIGINTAISTRSGGYDGVSLAVPVKLAGWVASQLRKNGVVERAFIGIEMQNIDADIADAFNLQVPRGVVVTNVVQDSPAEKAGLQSGDVVLNVDGTSIRNRRNIQAVVEQLSIGHTFPIRVLRDGRQRELEITVIKRPDDLGTRENVEDDTPPTSEDSATVPQIGMSIQNLTESLAAQLGITSGSGVVITAVDSRGAAAEVGLEPGMVISRVGNRNIRTAEELVSAVNQAKNTGKVLFLVKISNGSANVSRFVTVQMDG